MACLETYLDAIHLQKVDSAFETVQARKWPKAPEMGLREPKSGFPL
jgi:hypothetical protein